MEFLEHGSIADVKAAWRHLAAGELFRMPKSKNVFIGPRFTHHPSGFPKWRGKGKVPIADLKHLPDRVNPVNDLNTFWMPGIDGDGHICR